MSVFCLSCHCYEHVCLGGRKHIGLGSSNYVCQVGYIMSVWVVIGRSVSVHFKLSWLDGYTHIIS